MDRPRFIRIFACLAVALVALKFGCYIGSGEQPNFPMDGWEWVFFTGWPPYLAAAIGGSVLLLAAVAYPAPRLDRGIWGPMLWLLPLLAGLVGCINTTEWSYAGQWLLHFQGAFALAAGVWWIACNDGKMASSLCHTIGIVGLLLACHGWYQHFIGLEASREYALAHGASQGMKITGVIMAKMEQTRIFSFFIDPNVFASFLLLSMPFAWYSLYRFGHCYEGNPKAGGIVAGVAGAVLFLCALYWTGSRGGLLGLGAGLAAGVWALPQVHRWRYRWFVPGAVLLLLVAMLAAIYFAKSRDGLASASARLVYYRVSLLSFREHPFAGRGLGEFLSTYMRLMPAGAEITREPHNLFFSFLVQAGMVGGLVALLLCLYPWLVATFERDEGRGPLFMAAVIGTAGWFFHCMMQFNEIIPGCAYTAAVASVLLLPPPQGRRLSGKWRYCAIAVALLCFLSLLRVPGEYLLRQAELAASRPPISSHWPPEAVEILQGCSGKLPASPAPRKMLFELNFAVNRWQDAYDEAMALQRIVPRRASPCLYAAIADVALGKTEDAERQLAQAETRAPFSPETLLCKAALASLPGYGAFGLGILARQLKWCHADIFGKGDYLEICFPRPNHEMLADICEKSTIQAADGRPVRFNIAP